MPNNENGKHNDDLHRLERAQLRRALHHFNQDTMLLFGELEPPPSNDAMQQAAWRALSNGQDLLNAVKTAVRNLAE